jgi:GAF domain-containing protein
MSSERPTRPSGTCYSSDDSAGARCCALWQDAAAEANELETASWQATFRSGTDVVGRVMASGEPAWIEDVSAMEGVTLRAAVAGMCTAVAVPIVGEDEVVGVLEMFSEQRRRPISRMLSTLTEIGRQLGQFERAEDLGRSRNGLVDR